MEENNIATNEQNNNHDVSENTSSEVQNTTNDYSYVDKQFMDNGVPNVRKMQEYINNADAKFAGLRRQISGNKFEDCFYRDDSVETKSYKDYIDNLPDDGKEALNRMKESFKSNGISQKHGDAFLKLLIDEEKSSYNQYVEKQKKQLEELKQSPNYQKENDLLDAYFDISYGEDYEKEHKEEVEFFRNICNTKKGRENLHNFLGGIVNEIEKYAQYNKSENMVIPNNTVVPKVEINGENFSLFPKEDQTKFASKVYLSKQDVKGFTVQDAHAFLSKCYEERYNDNNSNGQNQLNDIQEEIKISNRVA